MALKILRPEVAGDERFVERFFREAKAAARLSHPNLTHVYFVGSSDGRPYFAMEVVPGTNLEEAVKKDGPLDFARGLDVLIQAARGLQAAHAAGVIHRDIKPANLMLLPDGTVKVTDFGLAKSLTAQVDQSSGGMVGTPAYMTPEQCRGGTVDARTDVYALGLTGWFLFAGRAPYASDQLGQVIHDQIATPLPGLMPVRPELPGGLETVLQRMCEKDPAKRPKDMAAVLALLEDLRPRPLHPATFGARVTAVLIDAAIVFATASAGFFLLYVLPVYLLSGQDLVHDRPKEAPSLNVFVEGLGPFLLALTLATAALGFLAEARWGASPGKMFLGLRVVRSDGTPPSSLRVLARLLLRFPALPILPLACVEVFAEPESDAGVVVLGLLLLQALTLLASIVVRSWIRKGRTLSDVLTGTLVVYRSDRTPAPPLR